MASYLRILWALFWRSFVILVVNAIITYNLGLLAYASFEQTDSSVRTRMALAFLPAAILFLLLARLRGVAQRLMLETRSPVPVAQWQQAYLTLFAGSAFIVLVSVIGLMLPTEQWLALRSLLPMPVFVILWLFLAGRFSRSGAGSQPIPRLSEKS
ncbi:hypothetical protein [Neorhizobium alkalisoli]|uniref:hypothetical protein n=1 Tax=Neorhizobium alkalisoli TaxID=528178 RepID=UPI000CF963FF|nr:hypothetical protein [Neorhizobium alkalisoli]